MWLHRASIYWPLSLSWPFVLFFITRAPCPPGFVLAMRRLLDHRGNRHAGNASYASTKKPRLLRARTGKTGERCSSGKAKKLAVPGGRRRYNATGYFLVSPACLPCYLRQLIYELFNPDFT